MDREKKCAHGMEEKINNSQQKRTKIKKPGKGGGLFIVRRQVFRMEMLIKPKGDAACHSEAFICLFVCFFTVEIPPDLIIAFLQNHIQLYLEGLPLENQVCPFLENQISFPFSVSSPALRDRKDDQSICVSNLNCLMRKERAQEYGKQMMKETNACVLRFGIFLRGCSRWW